MYREDLRNAVSLPVADWGLIFKPDQWLYPFVNAAYAYSFQHLLFIVAFLIGYALLFQRVGMRAATAALLSVALFFTAFVQFWWTTFAPNLAWFPWLLLSVGLRRPVVRSVATLWIAVVWLLGYFYPPMFIPLAVVGAAIYWSIYSPHRRPRAIALDGIVALAACGIAVFYLRDYLAATLPSEYPGRRTVIGGGIPVAMQWQTLWPTSYLTRFESDIPGLDICSASVVGSYYFLLAICFADIRQIPKVTFDTVAGRLMVTAFAGLLALLCWQSLPFPPEASRWFLLDRVPPIRTLFASGLLLLLAFALVVDAVPLRFSVGRLLAFALAVVLGWGMAKGALRPVPAPTWAEWAVLPVVLLAFAAGNAAPRFGATVLAGAAALLGLLTFAPFNPIQSAWPIFNREPTSMTRRLDRFQQENPLGVLVSDQFGATLNGWGYRSAAHVLITPQMDFWREWLPNMDAAKRDFIFDRFAHIVVRNIPEPQLVTGQVVAIPRSLFRDTSWGWFSVQPLAGGVSWDRRGGHLDTTRIEGRRLVLIGWAPWHADAKSQTLTLYTDAKLTTTHLHRSERLDVRRALDDETLTDSGFAIELDFEEDAMVPRTLPLCLVANDATQGRGVLIDSGTGDCDKYRR